MEIEIVVHHHFSYDSPYMRLTDYLKVQHIKVPLQATNKTDAIRELVEVLSSAGQLNDSKKVLDAVLEREAARTTGIGYGLAIPHGKTPGTNGLCMAIGKPALPIDYAAMDGKPVSIIWMLASPPDKTGLHLSMLARVSRMMMADKFRADLNRATDPQSIFNFIEQQENES
jgi:fructose-specific phosphotransferase system IIA component